MDFSPDWRYLFYSDVPFGAFRPRFRFLVFFTYRAFSLTGLRFGHLFRLSDVRRPNLVSTFTLDRTFSALPPKCSRLTIYYFIKKKSPKVNWGTTAEASLFNLAHSSALKWDHTSDHIKNYRPRIVCLTGNPSARTALLGIWRF